MFKVMYKYDDQSEYTEIDTFAISGSNSNNSTGNTDLHLSLLNIIHQIVMIIPSQLII